MDVVTATRDQFGRFIKGHLPLPHKSSCTCFRCQPHSSKCTCFRCLRAKGIKIKPSYGMLGKHAWNKGKKLSEEYKEKLRKAKIGYKPTFGGKHKNGQILNELQRQKIREKLLNHPVSEETKRKIREKRKKQVFPKFKTKPELKFIEMCKKYNLPYKFVGDGSFWIENVNPDFIDCNGKKVAVEIFGCFWHGCPVCNYPSRRGVMSFEYRERILKKYGWILIPIWEHEIENEEKILDKLGINRERGETCRQL
jgi:DNA mismatch endonuclease (patch repair protein)